MRPGPTYIIRTRGILFVSVKAGSTQQDDGVMAAYAKDGLDEIGGIRRKLCPLFFVLKE